MSLRGKYLKILSGILCRLAEMSRSNLSAVSLKTSAAGGALMELR
jgi:hypothetical protein